MKFIFLLVIAVAALELILNKQLSEKHDRVIFIVLSAIALVTAMVCFIHPNGLEIL